MALIISVVSAVAVVATVLYARRQAVYARRQARAARLEAEASSVQVAAGLVQHLDRMLVDHPGLWHALFADTPPEQLSPEDRQRLAPAAEAILSTYEFLISIGGSFGTFTNDHGHTWRRQAVADFARSPLLRAHLHARPHAWPQELHHLAAAAHPATAHPTAGAPHGAEPTATEPVTPGPTT